MRTLKGNNKSIDDGKLVFDELFTITDGFVSLTVAEQAHKIRLIRDKLVILQEKVSKIVDELDKSIKMQEILGKQSMDANDMLRESNAYIVFLQDSIKKLVVRNNNLRERLDE